MDLRQVDLAKLNSLTKYPSIPTFHALGDKGRLLDEHLPLPDAPLFATEKIDGTNCRILICRPDADAPAFLIGSRENWLHAAGDLIHDPAQQIVDAVRTLASHAARVDIGDLLPGHDFFVPYGEVYGGKVTAASKHYTQGQILGFRLFDVATFSTELSREMLGKEAREIAAWRDAGGQPFLDIEQQRSIAQSVALPEVPRVPVVSSPGGPAAQTFEWLRRHAPVATLAALDTEARPGRPEGLVLRTADRKFTAKLRFEDYERTTRR
jgi:hypothetical protein